MCVRQRERVCEFVCVGDREIVCVWCVETIIYIILEERGNHRTCMSCFKWEMLV